MLKKLKNFSKNKIKFKFELNLNERTKKALLILAIVLVVGSLFFSFKHWVVAAVVNGRPITRWALDQELEKQAGEQVLESLITQTLITQQARKEKIIISETQINEEIKKIEDELKNQGMDLDEFLTLQGQSRKTLEEQIKLQLMVESLLGSDLEVTDEEIQSYFEENRDYFPDKTAFEDQKENIKETLKQQKLSEAFQEWLEKAKEEASIYYWLEF